MTGYRLRATGYGQRKRKLVFPLAVACSPWPVAFRKTSLPITEGPRDTGCKLRPEKEKKLIFPLAVARSLWPVALTNPAAPRTSHLHSCRTDTAPQPHVDRPA